MASDPSAPLSAEQRAALDVLAADLQGIFGQRLISLVAYDLPDSPVDNGVVRTLALLEQLTFDDLTRCVPLASTWHRRGLSVPLLLPRLEFFRSLDVFPLEYGNIIANHVVIAGVPPFGNAQIPEADRRRGCEQQAKSHLIHLREGFLETEGHAREVMWLIVASIPAFRTLLIHIAQLENPGIVNPTDETLGTIAERTMGVPAGVIPSVLAAPVAGGTVADPTALLSRYIDACERLWRYVDGWRS